MENATVIPEMLLSEPKPLSTAALVLQAKLAPDSPLAIAVREFANRQSRQSHPDGKFDNAKRWNPSTSEHRDCCNSIRTPSRSYPYSLIRHCRTAEHVANLHGVNVSDVRRVADALKKENKAAGVAAESPAAARRRRAAAEAAEGRAMMAAAA